MKLDIQTSGRGPDLALVHGWGLGPAPWQAVIPALAEHFRVHRISLPGYDHRSPESGSEGVGEGAKDAEGVEDAGREDFMATAHAIAGSLPPGSLLCGWSLGGMLSMAAAATSGARFSGLVTVATTPRFVQGPGWKAAQNLADHTAFTAQVRANPLTALKRFVLLFNQGNRELAQVFSRLQGTGVNGTNETSSPLPDSATLERGLRWLQETDLRPLLSGLTLPTLVIHGDHDPLIPFAAGEWLFRQCPAAQMEVFPGCAHAPFVADPECFVACITRFYRDHVSGAAPDSGPHHAPT